MYKLFTIIALVGFSTTSMAQQQKKVEADQFKSVETKEVDSRLPKAKLENREVNSSSVTKQEKASDRKIVTKEVTADANKKDVRKPIDYVAERREEERKTGTKQISRSESK